MFRAEKLIGHGEHAQWISVCEWRDSIKLAKEWARADRRVARPPSDTYRIKGDSGLVHFESVPNGSWRMRWQRPEEL